MKQLKLYHIYIIDRSKKEILVNETVLTQRNIEKEVADIQQDLIKEKKVKLSNLWTMYSCIGTWTVEEDD